MTLCLEINGFTKKNRKGEKLIFFMKRLLFIFNPAAGKGTITGKLYSVINSYFQAGYLVTAVPTARQDILRTILTPDMEYDMIVCAGGDGTLNQVISAYMCAGCRIPIGYVPSGSTNDFAKTLGCSSDFQKALENTCSGTVRKIDVGSFDDRYFVYVAAFGKLAEISYSTSQSVKNILGHFAYILKGIQTVAELKAYRLKMECNDFVVEDDFIIGLVMNSLSVGGFKNPVSKDVRLDDGLFEVLLVRMPKNIVELQSLIVDLLSQNMNNELLIYVQTGKIKIESEPVGWSLDGEFGGIKESVEIQNCRCAVQIAGS